MSNVNSFFILQEKAKDDNFIALVIESSVNNFITCFRLKTDKAMTNIMLEKDADAPDFTDELNGVALKASKDCIRQINRLCKREGIPPLTDTIEDSAVEAAIYDVVTALYSRGIQNCSK